MAELDNGQDPSNSLMLRWYEADNYCTFYISFQYYALKYLFYYCINFPETLHSSSVIIIVNNIIMFVYDNGSKC